MKTFTDTTFAEAAQHGIGFGPGERWPYIIPKHIDGPVLHFSDGQMHWLSLWERIQYRMGWTGAEKLQRKLRPRLTNERERGGCTCHPSDNPPVPCARKYAFTECVRAALRR